MTPAKQIYDYCDAGVKLISYCPRCEKSYEPRQAKVIGEKEDSHLLWIECSQCSCAILAVVVIDKNGVYSAGLVTDADAREAYRFSNAPAIDVDDVLEMHGLLRDQTFLDQLFTSRQQE